MNPLQRTEQWYADRLGKWTGSRVPDATARTKTGWSTSRENYMVDLLFERITGNRDEEGKYTNQAMQNGIDREPDAITLYEFERNVTVELVGFINHPRIPMSGTSPDGLVGDDGAISVKCPLKSTHCRTWEGAPIDGGYLKSMQWEMAVTGRRWVDFVSYHPDVPIAMQLVIKRVMRDEKIIADLEKQAREFLAELDERYRRALLRLKGEDDTTLRQLRAAARLTEKLVGEERKKA